MTSLGVLGCLVYIEKDLLGNALSHTLKQGPKQGHLGEGWPEKMEEK